jgi:putative two-component system response regulator
VADVYDALISRRVYKAAMSHEQAAAIIIAGRGRHFDPDISDAFVVLEQQFRTISIRFDDQDEHLVELDTRAQRAAIGAAG